MVVPQSKCRFFWPPCIHRDPENHSGPGSGSETKSDLFDVEILKNLHIKVLKFVLDYLHKVIKFAVDYIHTHTVHTSLENLKIALKVLLQSCDVHL